MQWLPLVGGAPSLLGCSGACLPCPRPLSHLTNAWLLALVSSFQGATWLAALFFSSVDRGTWAAQCEEESLGVRKCEMQVELAS